MDGKGIISSDKSIKSVGVGKLSTIHMIGRLLG
jgi:hypothetical protein